jgi:alkanesulfonate monooxygenase SsuD/methylene tetrahydromethanopterin reductase-like flavin-dependent oxidoreductase (luciferase family)
MRFALFYEIPVPRPWDEDSERRAYAEVLEQAILADKLGFDSVWTVEHHFLEEYSHCSNPEVLYGAIAARTENIRIGYGVRLAPKPYNHPVRSAESAATLDVISGGRVEFGTGRSNSRAELEGFGIDPNETRAMWVEAVNHIAGCWMNDEYSFEGDYWSMPRRRVIPKPLQKPCPPMWAAAGSDETHHIVGSMGMGLLSFSVFVPMPDLKNKIDIYRRAIADCADPVGGRINNRVASFTMVHCAPTTEEAYEVGRQSFEWYPIAGLQLSASMPAWQADRNLEFNDFQYLSGITDMLDSGMAEQAMNLEGLVEMGTALIGDPDEVIRLAQGYEEIGTDLLFCAVQPYNIPHDKVMESIELLGHHVLPAFDH